MSEINSIINLGDIAKPATVLIEKISDAVGGYFKPFQIKRIAKAESEAEIIKEYTQIKLSELKQRTIARIIAEETKKQENIEKIIEKTIAQLENDSNPQNLDNDWIVNFFDKCKIITESEMQALWACLLAGEANQPGTFSKRTVNFLSDLDKYDAQLFQNLCRFKWNIDEIITPLVFDCEADIYNDNGIDFSTLKHLHDIGLISFNMRRPLDLGVLRFENNRIQSFYLRGDPTLITTYYNNIPLALQLNHNTLEIGDVTFTKVGQELASICNPPSVEGFFEYVKNHWLTEWNKP